MDQQGRPETGGMKFGDDWRGVFIRGDEAIGYWMTVDGILRGMKLDGTIENAINKSMLQNLANVLYSSCQTQIPNAPPITKEFQQMKPFDEAFIEQVKPT